MERIKLKATMQKKKKNLETNQKTHVFQHMMPWFVVCGILSVNQPLAEKITHFFIFLMNKF